MKISIFLIILLFFTCNPNLKSQNLNLGFGVEINQTRFRQNAPTINVPFKNPHMPGVGMGTYLSIKYHLIKEFSLQVAPLIGLYNTKSEITDDYQMNIFGFRFEALYNHKKINLKSGLEYNRLVKILGTSTRGTKADWTFFAHRRNLFGTSLSFGYEIIRNFTMNIRAIYFLKDFYSSGALDYNGNIVGPVEVTPFVFAVGLEYDFSKILKKKNLNNYKIK